MLRGLRRHGIRLAAVLYDEIRRHDDSAFGCVDHVAEVAECVVIGVDRNLRIDLHAIPGQQIGNARGMHAQLKDHRRR